MVDQAELEKARKRMRDGHDSLKEYRKEQRRRERKLQDELRARELKAKTEEALAKE